MFKYKLRIYAGFTYIGLLFVIALIGINLALAGTLYSFVQQRERERQLLFIGNQFKQAIALYYLRSPGTVKVYPRSLEDLLQDNRFVNLQRYLRKIYVDPMTKTPNWGLVKSPDGGIMGVHSLSTDKSLKIANFDSLTFNSKSNQRYSDWQFTLESTESSPLQASAQNANPRNKNLIKKFNKSY